MGGVAPKVGFGSERLGWLDTQHGLVPSLPVEQVPNNFNEQVQPHGDLLGQVK